MVIVVVPNREIGGWAFVMPLKRNTFSENSLAASKISRRKFGRRSTRATGLKAVKSGIPVPMPVCIFTSEPTDEIPVNEIESKQGTGVK
jgi:hypothetical protein